MFNESIKMAIDGMISNKMRTILTLLGIIIGVGAGIAFLPGLCASLIMVGSVLRSGISSCRFSFSCVERQFLLRSGGG